MAGARANIKPYPLPERPAGLVLVWVGVWGLGALDGEGLRRVGDDSGPLLAGPGRRAKGNRAGPARVVVVL